MPFYWGDTYGGVAADRGRGEAQDLNTYFRWADLVRQNDQQDFANAMAARTAAQNDQETALRWNLALQNENQNRAWHIANQRLEQDKFDWTKANSGLGDRRLLEQDSLSRANALLPVAQEGTLEDSQMTGLLPEHQQILRITRDAARERIQRGDQPIANAVNLLNRQTQLEKNLAQTRADTPGWFASSFPWPGVYARQEQRATMLPLEEAYQKKLEALKPALVGPDIQAARLRSIDPTTGFRSAPTYPWMKAPLPAATALAPRTGVLAPAPLPLRIRRKLDNAVFTYSGNPADVPLDRYEILPNAF